MVPTRWQENSKESQFSVLRGSLSCFLEMSSQVFVHLFRRSFESMKFKVFMMDLAEIVARFVGECRVLYRKTTHFASK